MKKINKKFINSFLLVLLFNVLYLRMFLQEYQYAGQLFLVSLLTLFFINNYSREIKKFFEKTSSFLGFVIGWGGIFGITYFLILISISPKVAFYAVLMPAIVALFNSDEPK